MFRSAALLLLLVPSIPLPAEECRLAAGAGVTEIDKVQQQGAAVLEAVLPPTWGPIQPVAGLHISRAGDAYLYAGGLAEWRWGERWRWNLGLCAGVYHFRDGYDLGGPLEFQSRLSLERLLPGGRRVGLSLQHISSGGFHRPNPGSERLIAYFAWPLR